MRLFRREPHSLNLFSGGRKVLVRFRRRPRASARSRHRPVKDDHPTYAERDAEGADITAAGNSANECSVSKADSRAWNRLSVLACVELVRRRLSSVEHVGFPVGEVLPYP